MKKTITLLTILLLVVFMVGCENSINPTQPQTQSNNEGISLAKGGPKAGCVTIQDGTLEYAAGHYLAGTPLVMGYDIFGYNYQAHIYNGNIFNAYAGRPGAGFPPWEGEDVQYLIDNPGAESHWAWQFRNLDIVMKWNDTWIANTDCNDDGLLDRGYACDPDNADDSACPGAWLTNHTKGTYISTSGDECETTEFVKIIAAPADATILEGYWYAADGKEIGPDIWGGFAIILQKLEDPCGDWGGDFYYKSLDHAGFGGW